MMSLSNISFLYPLSSEPVFRDFSLSIASGDAVLISGDMASGKTTLVYLLLGLEKPTTGHAHVPDIATIGYVPQSPEDSFIADTVEEELLFDGGTAAIADVCDRVGLPTKLLTRNPRTLSTGEAMLCAVARALMKNPQVLVLDDPFEGLDKAHREKVFAVIQQFVADPEKTIVVTTSDAAGAIHELPLQQKRLN
jgi:energy-coupling factor transporter ATP-binding protein EcfA2